MYIIFLKGFKKYGYRKINFGKIVKEKREEKGITREDFAKQINITYSALSMYERGERNIPDNIKITMIQVLNISLDYLILKSKSKKILKEILEEIDDEMNSYVYDLSMFGGKTYIDGFYDGLKKAKEIVEKLSKW